MERLDGRVALVTGGARGIGAATARALAEAGASVMVTDLLDEEGTAAAASIKAATNREVIYRHQDVSDGCGWTATLAACEAELGGLDILVNNAGIALIKPLADTSLADFRQVMAVNVEGVFLGMQAAIPVIAKRAERWKGGGSIINLSSIAGLVGSRSAIAYNASKGAVRLMTKSAALECSALGFKIRVNSVHPGRIDTIMLSESSQGFAGAERPNSPTMMGEAEDIAGVVRFLASDQAAFMTGSELVADGGFTAQ